MLKILDRMIYAFLICLPFSVAISPAPANVFMGLLIASYLAKKIIKKESPFFPSKINLPIVFLFAATIISMFHSVDMGDSIRGGFLRLLQYVFVLIIAAQEVKNKRHIWAIIIAVLLGLVLTSVNEIWQVVTGKDFIRGYATVVNIGLVRATSSFKDSNTLGVYLSAFVPLIIGILLYQLKGLKKIIFSLVGLLVLLGVALTYSRPTLLGVYVAFWYMAILKKDKLAIGILAAIFVVSPFVAPKPVKEWARTVEYNPLRFMCNDDRIAIYRNSLNMIKAHPVIGVGANTFMKNYAKYKENPEYRNVVTIDTLYAHNNFLHMAGEIGLVGLFVFLWFVYSLFYEVNIARRIIKDEFLLVVSISLGACLIAFLVNGLTESSLYSSRVAILFWYIAGFSLALKRISAK